MSDQEDAQLTPSEKLRAIIQTAVMNEVVQQIAPLRERYQVIDGRVTQLQRDFGASENKMEELQDVVLGNTRLRLKGLQAEIQELSDKLSKILKERDTLVSEVQGGRKVLYAIATLASIPVLQQLGIFTIIGKVLDALAK